MSKFATLKKSSNSLDRLTKEIEKINAPSERRNDDRFWQVERDKAGNGSAVIRFLPASEVDGDEALPWVRYFDHGFQGPGGKWYIEKSLTNLNQKDPVSEYNSVLWNSTTEDKSPQREQVRKQKRRLHYVANIYVVSDPKHPENEGKIFLFKFGKKIFDKISLLMNPEFEGDKPVNPFDFWKGANFKLRIRTVDGYPNYEQSLWESPAPLKDNDDELETIWKQEYSLKEFVDPSTYESYDKLKKRLDEVLELNKPVVAARPVETADTRSSVSEDDFVTDDDDEELAKFKDLA